MVLFGVASVRQGLDIVGIIDQADETLFQLVLTNPNHALSSLPPEINTYFRARRHDRQLVDKRNKLFSNVVYILLLICAGVYPEILNG